MYTCIYLYLHTNTHTHTHTHTHAHRRNEQMNEQYGQGQSWSRIIMSHFSSANCSTELALQMKSVQPVLLSFHDSEDTRAET